MLEQSESFVNGHSGADVEAHGGLVAAVVVHGDYQEDSGDLDERLGGGWLQGGRHSLPFYGASRISIRPSAWKVDSVNFVLTAFSEVRNV